MKFEPIENGCEPGTDGAGILCFYTDWLPREVDLPDFWLAVKAGEEACFGELTGVVPECCCGPSPTENGTWGSIKSTFRH